MRICILLDGIFEALVSLLNEITRVVWVYHFRQCAFHYNQTTRITLIWWF
jgi:hypothetical protein